MKGFAQKQIGQIVSLCKIPRFHVKPVTQFSIEEKPWKFGIPITEQIGGVTWERTPTGADGNLMRLDFTGAALEDTYRGF